MTSPGPSASARRHALTCAGVACFLAAAALTVCCFLFTHIRGVARATVCLGCVRQLSVALRCYADDHDSALPPGDRWCDQSLAYTAGSAKLFQCPVTGHTSGSDYWLNANVAGIRIDAVQEPETTIMVFEGANGWDQSGGPGDVVARHLGTSAYVFVEGHAERKAPEEIVAEAWSPTLLPKPHGGAAGAEQGDGR
jgi:hypothetical protein